MVLWSSNTERYSAWYVNIIKVLLKDTLCRSMWLSSNKLWKTKGMNVSLIIWVCSNYLFLMMYACCSAFVLITVSTDNVCRSVQNLLMVTLWPGNQFGYCWNVLVYLLNNRMLLDLNQYSFNDIYYRNVSSLTCHGYYSLSIYLHI